MKTEKHLLVTFDYELFLGEKSGSVRECLIEPTDKLLVTMEKYAIKSLFFVDTVYLLRLIDFDDSNKMIKGDLDAIINQLIRIVQKGHEIHPHIHPHWLEAKYDIDRNEWTLTDKTHYTFSSISIEQRKELFGRSVELLRSILDRTSNPQPVDSYRAGGWSIQPFADFKPVFIQFGIRNEWSVIPGKYNISDAHSFDFQSAPVDQPVYRFDSDPCMQELNGPFIEWTISTLTLNRLEKWIDFKISGVLQRLGMRPGAKGRTVSAITQREGDKYCAYKHKRIAASFEGLNPFTVNKYLSAIKNTRYFQFISHPKLLGDFEISMMNRLFLKLTRKYSVKTDFRQYVPE